jgi:hypothetical protein
MWQQRCCTSIQVTAECALVYYDVFLVLIHSVFEQNGNLQDTKIPIRSPICAVIRNSTVNHSSVNLCRDSQFNRQSYIKTVVYQFIQPIILFNQLYITVYCRVPLWLALISPAVWLWNKCIFIYLFIFINLPFIVNKVPYSWCQQSSTIFFVKVDSNGLIAFVMRIYYVICWLIRFFPIYNRKSDSPVASWTGRLHDVYCTF